MLKKLLRARFSKVDANAPRRLETPTELAAGDLVTFKHRLALPADVQGQTFEVSSVGTYQFEDGIYPQLTLDGAEAGRVYLSFKADDVTTLCLSRHAPRRDVLKLFDEAAFSALWDDEFADLVVATKLEAYDGWLADGYAQVKKWAEGYYYDRDCRGEELSQFEDDDSEELRYHECEDASGRFGLTIDVWGDGETEVSLDVNVAGDVVESMLPGSAMSSRGARRRSTLLGTGHERFQAERRALGKVQVHFEFRQALMHKIRMAAAADNLSYADYVRKAVGLPYAKIQRPRISLSFGDADLALLAERYDQSAADPGDLKRCVMDEIRDRLGSRENADGS